MLRSLDDAEELASQIVALTSLHARWAGASAERIADDVAASLFQLCESSTFVGVRVALPPGKDAVAIRPEGARVDWPATIEGARLVSADDESQVSIGPMGKHGEIFAVLESKEDLPRARLLMAIAANQVEAACKALDLERDIAQAHAKLAALGKLGALGQLVGGVAHEIRTPLTYATNNLYLLARDLDRLAPASAPALRGRMDEMGAAIERVGSIVNQLRRFVKSEPDVHLEEDLRDLVQDALRLWRATHVGGTKLVERLAPTPPVRVDRGQLQQVVLNLVLNASEATGAAGRVEVRTLSEGDFAVLEVADDGPGMDPMVLANLFQPFRTTKRDGLGLGLSIVRSIVEAHHGDIVVDSRPGKGVTMRVRLPRAQGG